MRQKCLLLYAGAPPIAYNDGVNKPATPNLSASERDRSRADRRRILRTEAIGLIVIALAILLYTILRFGAHINWSAR